MSQYLAIHPFPQGPLFVFSQARFITCANIVDGISRCLPKLHSFRIGGASAAASAGLPNSTIQILDRWLSDAYRGYLHLSNNSVATLTF